MCDMSKGCGDCGSRDVCLPKDGKKVSTGNTPDTEKAQKDELIKLIEGNPMLMILERAVPGTVNGLIDSAMRIVATGIDTREALHQVLVEKTRKAARVAGVKMPEMKESTGCDPDLCASCDSKESCELRTSGGSMTKEGFKRRLMKNPALAEMFSVDPDFMNDTLDSYFKKREVEGNPGGRKSLERLRDLLRQAQGSQPSDQSPIGERLRDQMRDVIRGGGAGLVEMGGTGDIGMLEPLEIPPGVPIEEVTSAIKDAVASVVEKYNDWIPQYRQFRKDHEEEVVAISTVEIAAKSEELTAWIQAEQDKITDVLGTGVEDTKITPEIVAEYLVRFFHQRWDDDVYRANTRKEILAALQKHDFQKAAVLETVLSWWNETLKHTVLKTALDKMTELYEIVCRHRLKELQKDSSGPISEAEANNFDVDAFLKGFDKKK